MNTAVFSVAEFLFRPLPVKNPDQLVVLATGDNGRPEVDGFSYPEYQDLKQQANVFSDMIGYQIDMEALSTGGRAEQFFVSWVTGNYFSMLGVKPYLGRLFLPNEGQTPGADPYLVLGYSYWQKRFHGDPDVIGKKVLVAGHPLTIMGITPKVFRGTFYAFDTEGYVLFSQEATDPVAGGFWTKRDQRLITIMGRLRAGVGLPQAQASASVIAQRFAHDYPDSSRTLAMRVYPEKRARPQRDPSDQTPMAAALFLGLAGLVALLACINVANILLVRGTVRQREMAVRAALGAGRGRLLRQLFTESVLLALLGGAAGVVLGIWGGNILGSLPAKVTQLPFQTDFTVNWRVFGFAFVAALAAGVVVGILPARRAARIDLNAVLHEGGRSVIAGQHRLRSFLVMAEVAASLVLLVIAGLFTRSLENALHMNLGFDPNHLVTLTVDPHEMGYSEQQGRKFFRELLEQARALPGVESAALSYAVPMGYYNQSTTLDQVQDHPRRAGEAAPAVSDNRVSPGYFETLRIPLLQGRGFTAADDQDAPRVAVVNRAFAERFWPKQEAMGKRFQIKAGDQQERWFEIVGVVGNGKYISPIDNNLPYFYLPLAQSYSAIESLQVRSQMPPDAMLNEMQQLVRRLAPDLPVFDAHPMRQTLDSVNGFFLYRVGAGVAGIMGLLGLILAVIGVYGVVSYAAAQRTHEIGVRMALGAARSDILLAVLRNGLWLVAAGIGLGLALVVAAARVVADFLVGVSPTDPLTVAGVSLLLALVAVAACYIPARRAMQLDPMVALRYE